MSEQTNNPEFTISITGLQLEQLQDELFSENFSQQATKKGIVYSNPKKGSVEAFPSENGFTIAVRPFLNEVKPGLNWYYNLLSDVKAGLLGADLEYIKPIWRGYCLCNNLKDLFEVGSVYFSSARVPADYTFPVLAEVISVEGSDDFFEILTVNRLKEALSILENVNGEGS